MREMNEWKNMSNWKHDGRSWFAVLDEDGNPVGCDFDTWSDWFARAGQRILQQDVIGGHLISTVFIGCKHWFETMVFDPADKSIWQDNCDTKAEAIAGHELAMRLVENGEIRQASGNPITDRYSLFDGLSDPDRDEDTRD